MIYSLQTWFSSSCSAADQKLHSKFLIFCSDKWSGSRFFQVYKGASTRRSFVSYIICSCVRMLSRGIHHLILHDSCMQYRAGERIVISHVAFADDVLVFSKARGVGLEKLMEFLKKYEDVFGQQVNLNKSFFVLGKRVTQQKLHRIKEITGMQLQNFPFNHLGAKLYKGRKKALLFGDIIGKMRTS